MEVPTERLRGIARQLVDEARRLGPLRGALLAGSAGRGDADAWSDVDLILYVDELPPEGSLERLRAAVEGTDPKLKGPRLDDFEGTEFLVDGVRVEVSYCTAGRVERRLRELLDELEPVGQHGAIGILEGLSLCDDGVIESWRERLHAFPEPLRRALVERAWRDFFPIWEQQEQLAARDAELWRVELLLDGAFRLLEALAALNRVYFDRFEFKRMRRLTDEFALAPPGLAERLESLPRLPPAEASEELRRLAAETRALTEQELHE